MTVATDATATLVDIHAQPDGQFHWTPASRQGLAQGLAHNTLDATRLCTPAPERSGYQRYRDAVSYDHRYESNTLLQVMHHQPDLAFAAMQGLLNHIGSAFSNSLLKAEHGKARKLLKVALDWHDTRLPDLLLLYPNEPMMQDALVVCVARWPLFMLRRLLDALPQAPMLAALLLNSLRAHPDWLEPLQQTCDEAQRARLDRLTADLDWAALTAAAAPASAAGDPAPVASLPPDTPDLLRQPPWLRATKPTAKEKAAQPWLKLPAKLPSVPHFIVPDQLAELVLQGSGQPLPAALVSPLVQMLALCKPQQPYVGLAQVLPAFTPASLAALGLALWRAWEAADCPTEHKWMLLAQAWLGDVGTVRQLERKVAEWPSEMAFGRAKLGLQVLADLGSYQRLDEALRALVRFAEKGKPSLRGPARQQVEIAAAGMGLSPEQLADRLVPDLGLTPAWAWVFQLGERAYNLHFDASLQPYVTDSRGTRLKDLPKPTAAEGSRATDEAQRWKALKKAVRTLAAEQIPRLERALMSGRTWTRPDFERLFIQHPLLRLLGQRLLWVSLDGQGGQTLLRLSEEFTLLDAEDQPVALADDARITLAHPLELSEADLAPWRQVWQDYEIVPPFDQLHRAVFHLTPDELAQPDDIARLRGQPVAVGSLLGLLQQDWKRQADGAYIYGLSLPLGQGSSADLSLEEGWDIGNPTATPVQHIRCAGFAGPTTERQRSEVLRTLSLLPPA